MAWLAPRTRDFRFLWAGFPGVETSGSFRKATAGPSLTTPELHPTDEDLSVGTPGTERRFGAPCAPDDRVCFAMNF